MNNITEMTSTQPYVTRAFYDWIVDNNCSPYVVVDAEYVGAVVPEDYIENGQIILDLSPEAIQRLDISQDQITFDARFGGVAMQVILPFPSVKAIYAQETGRGMVFAEEAFDNLNLEPYFAGFADSSGTGTSASTMEAGLPVREVDLEHESADRVDNSWVNQLRVIASSELDDEFEDYHNGDGDDDGDGGRDGTGGRAPHLTLVK